jgi:hypothetical protein
VATLRETITGITSNGSMSEPDAREFLSNKFGRPITESDLDADILDFTEGAPAPAKPSAPMQVAETRPRRSVAEEPEEGMLEGAAKGVSGFAYGGVGAVHGAAEGVGDVLSYPSEVASYAKETNRVSRQLAPLNDQFDKIRASKDLTDEQKDKLLTPMFEKSQGLMKQLETAQSKIKGNSVAQAQDDQAEIIRTRLRMGRGTFDNLVKDVNDIARAFPHLFKEMIFTTVPPSERKELEDWDKYLEVAYDQRRRLARNLVGGTIGGTSGIMMGLIKAPAETIEATPGMTVMTLVGMLPAFQLPGTIAKLKGVPGYARLMKAMEKAGAVEIPGTKKRKQLVKGAEEGAPGVQRFKEGEGRLTAGDVAGTAAKGFGYGMLVGMPAEIATIAPIVRTLYGFGMDHPGFAEAAAKVRRLVVHTAAQRGMTEGRAVRDLRDDAARNTSNTRALAEGLAREQVETGAALRVVPQAIKLTDDLPVVEPRLKAEFASPRARELGDRLDTILDDLGFGENAKTSLRENLADITEGGPAVLASPTVRAAVAKRILEGSGKNRSRYEPQVMSALEQAAGNVDFKVMDLSRLIDKDGASLNLKQLVDGALGELGPKQTRRIQADLIVDEFAKLESRIAVRSRQRAMEREAMKFLTDEQKKAAKAGKLSSEDYAFAMAAGRMLQGDSINQSLLRGMEPSKLIDSLDQGLGTGALEASLAKRLGRELTEAERKLMPDIVREMADDLRKYGEEILNNDGLSVAEMSRLLDGDWNLAQGTIARRGAEEMVKAIEQSSANPRSARYLSDGLRATDAWSNRFNLNMGSIWGRLNSYMKMNLTVMNPAVHLNNFMSNVSLQSIRRGVDPVSMLTGAARETGKYLNWRRGKSGPRQKKLDQVGGNRDQRIYESIDEMKLIDTDLVGVEVDSVAGYGLLDVVSPGIKTPGRRLTDRIRERAAKGYRWGDQIFKIDEAAKSMRQMYKSLDELKPGQSMDIQTSALTKTRIRKDAGGDIFIGRDRLSKGGKFIGKGRERLDRAFTATARKQAMDLFVDYAQVPGALKALRMAGPLSLASPFLTWAWKAMGIGGPSLLARAVNPQPLIRSTSPEVMVRQGVKLAAQTANRNLILNGIRSTMLENRDAIDQILAYDPSMPRVQLYTALGDPRLIGADDVDSMNFAGPAMSVMRAGATAASLIPGFTPGSERDKLLAMQSRGELLSGSQALRLVGLQGGALQGLWDNVSSDFRTIGGKPNVRGQRASNPEILRRTVLPLMVPLGRAGTAMAGKSMDVAMEIFIEDGKYSSALRNTHHHKRAPESMGQFLTRNLFGIGWKPIALSGDDNMFNRYLDRVNKTLESSSAAMEKKLKRQFKEGVLTREEFQDSMVRYRRMKRSAKEEYREVRKSVVDLRKLILKKAAK